MRQWEELSGKENIQMRAIFQSFIVTRISSNLALNPADMIPQICP